MKLTNLPKLLLAVLCLGICTHAQAADCLSNLPDALKSAVEQENWKILSPFDLPSEDWKLWKNAHQGQCPGVTVGNFSPKASSKTGSWVVALIQGDDPKNQLEQLVLVTTKKGQPITEIIVAANPGHNSRRRLASAAWPLCRHRRHHGRNLARFNRLREGRILRPAVLLPRQSNSILPHLKLNPLHNKNKPARITQAGLFLFNLNR